MMKRFVLIALAAVAAILLVRGWGSDASDDSRGKLAFDRLWIDHVPRNDKDPVQVFVMITKQPLGVFEAASRWRGRFEAFQYKRGDRGTVAVHYPQSGDTEKVSVRARECGRGEFEYCLEIEGSSRGVKSYVSKKAWVIRSVDEGKATLDSLTP